MQFAPAFRSDLAVHQSPLPALLRNLAGIGHLETLSIVNWRHDANFLWQFCFCLLSVVEGCLRRAVPSNSSLAGKVTLAMHPPHQDKTCGKFRDSALVQRSDKILDRSPLVW